MLDRLLAPVDLYCERTDPSLWSEPVNAATNLLIAAGGFYAVAVARRAGADAFATALAWCVVVVGFGSLLFHTFANPLTAAADVLPIAVFTLGLTFYVLRTMFGLTRGKAATAFVAFFAAAGMITLLLPEWVHRGSNGSTGYLPAFLALAFFGTALAARGHPAGRSLLVALCTLTAAVFFRSIDAAACESFPIGTHFLWHSLNAITLTLLALTAIRHGERQNRPL